MLLLPMRPSNRDRDEPTREHLCVPLGDDTGQKLRLFVVGIGPVLCIRSRQTHHRADRRDNRRDNWVRAIGARGQSARKKKKNYNKKKTQKRNQKKKDAKKEETMMMVTSKSNKNNSTAK